MATNTSATTRKEASHTTQTSHVNQITRTATINNALKRRAQAVLNDESIDPQTRAIIRYGLETNDPWLAKLVRRADAGENLAETFDYSRAPQRDGDGSTEQQNDVLEQTISAAEVKTDGLKTNESEPPGAEEPTIEALAEMICGGGDQAAAALFVLMGIFEDSAHPDVLANTIKHLAFTRCGELNLFGMVDVQLALVEDELFANGTTVS